MRPRIRTRAALLLLSSLTVAARAQEAFTAGHVARLRTVTQVAIAPSGGEVAYVLSVPRIPLEEEDGPAWTELHVVSAAGRSRPFVTGAASVSQVRWTPDGRSLAFLAKRGTDATRSLYLLAADGGEARRTLTHATDIASFEVSPDGRQIAFLARDAEPAERKDLARRGFSQQVFEENLLHQRVWVASFDAGTAGVPRRIEARGHATALVWNAASSRLAVLYAPTPLVDDELMEQRVHVVDPARGEVVARIDNPGKIGQVAWSPDGALVAMVSAADRNDPSAGRLMVAPASGGAPRDVMPDYEAHLRAFAWADASTLVFLADEGVWSVVGEMHLDGTARRTLLAAGGPIFTALQRATNGSLALVGHSARHPAEAFLLPHGATAAVRLTQSNPWLSTLRLANQEMVTWKARDGLALEGILVRPLDEQPGRRYPLILTVHGGPESRDANGWVTTYSHPGQVGAAQGFAVLYSNYRGSTGRGVSFSKLGQGDAAGKEFDDLVDAVDHLIATGLVDGAKVGITGGSYGGYASAWCATYYTDRFAAAVMFVGISNTISKVGTTDIANEEFLVHALKRPWEDWDFLLKRSPVYYAAQSKTPTLILHGTADPRVHPAQSLELYRHLEMHDKTVRLVWYPGEGHGNTRAASRLDYSLRLMQWMTHYLQGPGGAPPPDTLDYKAALGRGQRG